MLIELLEVGKKVSKSRLDRLKLAMKGLQDILDEVDDEKKADEKAESLLPAILDEASAVVKKGEKFILFEDGIKKGEFEDEDKATAALKKLRSEADDKPKDEAVGEMDLFEVQELNEKAVRKDGTIDVKIASEGWGTHGFYAREVLERDGPAAWPKGTKMYWDHATATERLERPERSLKDLAAVTEADPRWRDDGPAGPGLYAPAKVMSAYQGAVNELAPHIGVSLHGFGTTRFGEKEGRKGPIIEKLVPTPHNSVDFVTLPGRGGQVLQLFESARGGEFTEHKEDSMPPEQGKELQEANANIARLQERLILRDAKDFVVDRLRSASLPDITKTRLTESLSRNPVTKDGELDAAEFSKVIDEAVKAEAAYLASVGVGQPRGLGFSESQAPAEFKQDEFDTELAEAFSGWGLDEKATKQAVTGRRN